jgi:hypothetical protein
MVVGAAKFTDGKSAHISGISAKGLTLTFHLVKKNPTFVNILGMQWFNAVKPNMKYTKSSGGILKYPSAGPYYIASNSPGRTTVLKRNKFYHGSRVANPDQIVINSYPNSDGEASLLQIEKNQVDFDLAGVPSADIKTVSVEVRRPEQGPVPRRRAGLHHLGGVQQRQGADEQRERPQGAELRDRPYADHLAARPVCRQRLRPDPGQGPAGVQAVQRVRQLPELRQGQAGRWSGSQGSGRLVGQHLLQRCQ